MTEKRADPVIRRRYLYLLVFTSGMTTLALELTASRLLGNVFGTSNVVWANVIGLMLVYLSVGYTLGGRIADRSPHLKTLCKIVAWGAFLSALIPLIARPVLQRAASAFVSFEAALAAGSFVAVLILFSLPVTLLGMTSPFAVRLAVTDLADAGRVSGRIYAVSTIGSIVGTFLPVLYTIPEWGVTTTFLAFAGVLFVVAWAGLWWMVGKRAWRYWLMPGLSLVLWLLVGGSVLRAARAEFGLTLIYDDDSAYNYIQVQQDEAGNRYLYLNEGQGIHSQWHPEIVFYRRTWDYFLAAPYFNDDFQPQDMRAVLIIGLAAGTIARQHQFIYGDIPIDGLEIDGQIIDVGRQFFGLDGIPTLTAYAEDGRYGLRRLTRSYSLIAVDAYRPPYIPYHLTTVEFFRELQARLLPDGVVAINVGRTHRDRRLIEALTNTMQQVFSSVHSMDVLASFNTILVGTQTETTPENLLRNAARLSDDYAVLRTILGWGSADLVETKANDVLFTDDRAPLETLIDSLVLGFLLGDGLEVFR
ncbi:MAG: fused MFS/spermidine synthase [Anaerolineae bacterium]|nr:fused MFS/spermidine synthase [Anaerolineae bacterium]